MAAKQKTERSAKDAKNARKSSEGKKAAALFSFRTPCGKSFPLRTGGGFAIAPHLSFPRMRE